MPNRRELLLGTSAFVLTASLPSVTFGGVDDVKEKSINLIIERLQLSLDHCLLFDSVEDIPERWKQIAPFRNDFSRLRAHVIETAARVYSHPVFFQRKAKLGSIVNEDGRMWPSLQEFFYSSFGVIPSQCDDKLFLAYVDLAPSELL